MSDRLDKDLSKHIREVFDAYEEPYDPLNWQRLQRKRRIRAVGGYLKWVGAAASVALLLSAGLLLWNRGPLEKEPFLAGRDQRTDTGSRIESVDGSGTDASPAESLAGAESPDVRPAKPDAVEDRSAIAALEPAAQPVRDVQPERENPAPAAESSRAQREALLAEAETGRDSGQLVEAEKGAEEPGEAVIARQQAVPKAVEETQESERLIAADPQRPDQAEEVTVYSSHEDKANEKSGSRFSVGLVTTSLMNYANGNTASQVHFGAGITSGWKLSDRLSVHSGVILAENSLSLDRSNSSVRESTYAVDRATNTELSAVGKNTIVQAVSPNSMDVSLLVVDIPLNVTYRVDLGASNLLLTGGLSSFAYLDQQYSYHNTMQLYTNASVEAPEPMVRQEKAFSHFDLARQLNLAIGTELPLGKGSVLILEPYVKYPLGELTSEKIRFGSAGMNLRLSFGGR